MTKPDLTLTDSELDAIIDAPRPEVGRKGLSSTDLTFYLSKWDETPHYQYMDKQRMTELFKRFKQAAWISPIQDGQIDKALKHLR